MNIRKLTKSDYKTLEKWWKGFNWQSVPRKEILPENGTGGLMIEKENKCVAAVFIYNTNSSLSWITWLVSDPNYKQRDKAMLIETLIKGAEQVSKNMGKKGMFAFGKTNSIVNIHKKLGWFIDEDKPGKEMIKLI